jgi:hypothetical protein
MAAFARPELSSDLTDTIKTISSNRIGLIAVTALCVACSAVTALALASPAAASKSQWALFEDHVFLVRSGPAVREQTLNEIRTLGADTLRIEVKWSEVAPSPGSKTKPSFSATDPAAYPGFQPYDDLVQQAFAQGFRIVITLAPDAPNWATAGGRGGNYKVDSNDFAEFARAVGRRYSGVFGGLPAVKYFSIWNEPNHIFFLKPRSQSPRVYRRLVERGVPALRATAAPGSRILVGELAPVGTATKVLGPKRFIQGWLCLDKRFKRLRGSAARKAGCKGFKKVRANGFAHHPYGPTGAVPANRDIINISVIRRLATVLDKAARAGRINRGLGIYNTEFGFQTNPPDPFISTSPSRQAELLNEKEEYSYRYSRVKSYSQYLLHDDPPRPGPSALKWAGFQTGLKSTGGTLKPSYDAYRLPIVVRKRGKGVLIWGRVRPGSGKRFAQLQRKQGGSFVNDGSPISTNSGGYFTVTRTARASYRFIGFAVQGGAPLGNSRTARAK